MAKIAAARNEEIRNRSEFKCMPLLCNIINSQNGCSSPEIIISNKLITDYRRKHNHRASFDEECRKIQNGTDLESRRVKAASVKSLRDTQILKQKTQDTKLCEDFLVEKYERVDSNMQPIQMSAKDFLDQIIADRKLICNEGARIEAKPFSNALQVLSSDKDLFIEFLSEPFFLPQKCIKNLQNCSTSDTRSTLKAEVQNGSSVASFSVREMKRKLKHTFRSRGKESKRLPNLSTTSTKLSHNRSVFGHDCIYSGVETKNPSSYSTDSKTKEKLGKNRGLKVEREPLVSESKTVRKKIDFSSDSFSFCSEHEVDASSNGRCNLQKQWRVLSSFEIDSCLSPRRESHYIGSAQVSLSPCRLSKETSSSFIPSTDEEEEEAQEVIISPTPNMKFNATGDTRHSERAVKIELDKDEYGGVMHSIMVSAASSLLSDSTRYQEERQSPVSVLDQFLTEDSTSPSNAVFQSTRGPLKPRRLHFEEHEPSSSSSSQDYTISNYVRLIFKASSLNWDQLSAIRPSPKHLLNPSFFDQAQFLMFDSHFDTRLLFDHINEVLLETKRTHFTSPYWPAFAKPKICSLPLEETVVDEIMREAEFYLLPCTQSRTLDQLLAIDFSSSRSRPDFRAESEQIIVHISEDILEESVLDVVLQLYS